MPTKVTEVELSPPVKVTPSEISNRMQSSPALTMTLAGVSFRLTPSSMDSTVTFAMGSEKVSLLELRNFTGSLRVDISSTPPVVVDEPTSPAKDFFQF